MAIDPFEVRKAIFTRLDAQLTPQVYSFVPQDAAYPYVRIGEISALQADTKTSELQQYEITIHCFAKDSASSGEVEDIIQAVYAALHRQEANVSVSGFTSVEIRQTYMQVLQQGDPNDRYWHGVQRFSFLVED